MRSQEDFLSALEECLPNDHSTPKTILSRGIPLLKEKEKIEERIEAKEEKNQAFRSLIYSTLNIDLGDIHTFLSSQIPLLAALPGQENLLSLNSTVPTTAGTENVPVKAEDNPHPFQPSLEVNKKLSGEPLVAIYHTHTAESYLPWYGQTHAVGGKRGNIVDVGSMLAKALEGQNIKVVHSLAIHDYPTFRESYRRSYVTASSLVKKYPSLKLIIDLHRDAGVKEKTTVQIEGEKVARVLLDVGTDRLGLPHPHWRQNLALAQAIEKKMNEMYPNLCRGIVISDARYNQHVSPRAILLEIGDENTTKDEANNSAILCGKVLAKVLAENQ